MACNYCFPNEDNIPNKFRIFKEMPIQMRKPLPGWTKISSYYSAVVEAITLCETTECRAGVIPSKPIHTLYETLDYKNDLLLM